MAEFVEYSFERMLPEYEEMKKEELFTDEEIRKIIKTRESFEYKIEIHCKTKKDICEYISYERSLIETVAEKKNHKKILKRCNIERSIMNHIKNLYKQALSKFPEELDLWYDFIEFCTDSKFISDVTTAFEKMTQIHADKPAVWLRAVLFECSITRDMDKVKDLMLRGLQKHPDNSDLYTKFFEIKLHEASCMNHEPKLHGNTHSEQSLGLEKVVVVYESSKKKINDINFFVKLLKIAENYDFARSLQKRIIDDMKSTFPQDEIMWDTLAQRELSVDLYEKKTKKEEDDDFEHVSEITKNTNLVLPAKTTPKGRIELCVDIYESAVQKLKTEKMWSLYINAMLELNIDQSTQQVLKRTALLGAYKSAHEAGYMSENHYLHYIELLKESKNEEENTLTVMEKATSMYSDCEKLWEQCMRYHINYDQEKKLYEVFQKAIKVLEFKKAYPLWRLLLQYYQLCPNMSYKVEKLFEQAVRNNSPVFGQFKVKYLEWTVLYKSMTEARELYNELVNIPPPCVELHQKMASLESTQITTNIEAWRKCHEDATKFFGENRTDVWINYIKFERDYGDSKKINLLNERAKETLNVDAVDNFISEYSLIMTGVV